MYNPNIGLIPDAKTGSWFNSSLYPLFKLKYLQVDKAIKKRGFKL